MWSCLLRMPSKGCLNFWVAFVFRCIFFLFRFELVHPKFYTWCLKFLDIGHFGILLYWWFTWYQFYSTWYVKRFRRRLMWCIITKTGTSLYFSILYFIFILFFHLFFESFFKRKYSIKISWYWFIWFHEFFGLEFINFLAHCESFHNI